MSCDGELKQNLGRRRGTRSLKDVCVKKIRRPLRSHPHNQNRVDAMHTHEQRPSPNPDLVPLQAAGWVVCVRVCVRFFFFFSLCLPAPPHTQLPPNLIKDTPDSAWRLFLLFSFSCVLEVILSVCLSDLAKSTTAKPPANPHPRQQICRSAGGTLKIE